MPLSQNDGTALRAAAHSSGQTIHNLSTNPHTTDLDLGQCGRGAGDVQCVRQRRASRRRDVGRPDHRRRHVVDVGDSVMKRIVALAAAVVAVAGCNSSNGDAIPPRTTPAAVTTSASAGRLVAQFVSVVAEQDGNWRNRISTVDEDCVDPACELGLLTVSLTADTVHTVIAGAHDPQSKTYLGDPPEQIAQLLKETEAAAAAVQPAYHTWDAAGCSDPHDEKCFGEYLQLEQSIDTLTAKFDAWTPYESDDSAVASTDRRTRGAQPARGRRGPR
jgi:hypothetical protein